MRKLSVMVVDDSIITIKNLSKILNELGYNVVASCINGQQALEKYQELKPDLVTMDITMPDMDGMEATKKIMAADPKALVIMITSHGQQQMVLDAIEAGAKGYILKPFNKDKVAESIKKLKDRYRRK